MEFIETNPQPKFQYPWQEKEFTEKKEKLQNGTHEKDGVLYWNESGNVVPPWTFKEAGYEVPEKHQKAYDEDVEKSITAYKKQQKNTPPSEEVLAEMRAAFGPGETVVDVLSGKEYHL